MPDDQRYTPAISESLAGFFAGAQASDIPADVRVRGLHHALDAIGIALASTKFDFAQATLRGLQSLGGTGDVPVIGTNVTMSPRDAAIMNGYLIHSLDFDDTHMGGVIHPTASVLPAALSAGAMTGASGKDIVTAYILGVEVASRLGAVAQGGFHQVGFHPTGAVGVFASALVAGKIMGLNAQQLAMAQGITLSMAAGSLEFLEDGAWNKRLHPGWAAAAGITAAALAKEGFQGASKPYEGRFGFFNSYLGKESGRAKLSIATDGLGETWELLNTAIKPYPACHFVHASVDAALELKKQGVEPANIDKIEDLIPGDVVKTVCEPEAAKMRPANAYEAQFSIPFAVAAAFVRGKFTLAELEPEARSDKAILGLAQKVKYKVDPDSPFPKAYSGEVIVTLKDGKTVRHREHVNRGAMDRPLSNGDIIEKYRGNAALCVNGSEIDKIQTAVLAFDDAKDAAALLSQLAVG